MKRAQSGIIKTIVYLLVAGLVPANIVFSAPAAQAAPGLITFNANYGTTPATYTQNITTTSANLTPNTFVRPGYTFIGWSTTATNWSVTNGVGSFGSLIADGSNYTPPGAQTLYAQWIWDFAKTTSLINLTSGVVTTAATQGVQTSAVSTLGTPGLIQVGTNTSGLYFNVNSPRNFACTASSEVITQAFDKAANTKFCISNTNAYTTDWATGGITFSYPAPVIVNGLGLVSAMDTPVRDPLSWTLLGSSTGANGSWSTVATKTYTGNVPDGSGTRSAPYPDTFFSNPTAYKYYQFVVNSLAGGTTSAVGLIQFSELKLLFNPAPVLSTPVIVGGPQVGLTLAASSGPIGGGTTGVALSYKWQIATSASGPFTDIAGATGATYVPAAGDVDDYIQVVVTATNASGSSTATTSVVGPVIASGAPAWPTGISNSQQPVNFTSCGVTGANGPTYAQCQAAYTSLGITTAAADGTFITYTTAKENPFFVGESVTVTGINMTGTSVPASGFNITGTVAQVLSPYQFTIASPMYGAIYSNGGTVSGALPSWLSNTNAYNVRDGYQYWTVPVTGTYQISATGASGTGTGNGNWTSYGATASGKINLVQGQVLKILVGQTTNTGSSNYSPGGGGTFIAALDNTPILVAGGGGGSQVTNATANAPVITSTLASGNYLGATVTTPALTTVAIKGAVGNTLTGTGGGTLAVTNFTSRITSSGAGFFGDAGDMPGSAFVNGGVPVAIAGATFVGGFGGGGAAGYTGGGGGGGWAGGSGGYNNEAGNSLGTGGGSFITATASSVSITQSPTLGNGSVSINLVSQVANQPVNINAPVVSTPNNDLSYGVVVSTTQGNWSNASTYSTQWYSCASANQLDGCLPLAGETGTTYSSNYLADARYVFAAVTATSAAGTQSVAYSTPIGPFINGALFTTCGATGPAGPTSCPSTPSTNLMNFPRVSGTAPAVSSVSSVSAGIQYWVVPATGIYRIKAMGASISTSASGLAAVSSADISLVKGEVLKIVVGQSGIFTQRYLTGGSGGSFVAKIDNTPLVIGGGAGASYVNANVPPASKFGYASTTTSTLTGTYAGATVTSTGSSYGTNLNGVAGSNATGSGSTLTGYYGAGGFNSDGSLNPNSGFINGALGLNTTNGNGGFGGGAGTGVSWLYGGGGGWAGGPSSYSASDVVNQNYAGAGSSFVAAGLSNVSITQQQFYGPGQVQVSLLSATSGVPVPTVAPVETAT